MSAIDHWHPVLPARRLGARPVPIALNQQQLVLFRGSGGRVGALDDVCPHRRMRLSRGSVVQGRLQCAYHGWSFDCTGHGESPGTPKLRTCAPHYETCERWGWIWVKPSGCAAELPEFNVEGYEFIGTLSHVAPVPLEIVLDNFTEVEHTPTTHALLGFELSRMTEVVTEVESTPDWVRVYNAGPQKRLSKVTETLFGIRTGDRFVDDWTTYFSPVYAVYDQYWSDPASGQERGVRWRIWVFFTPLDQQRTALATFAFARAPADSPLRRWLMFKPVMLWFVNREVTLDMRMLDQLADKSPGIDGMKLSRFDKVLGLHRERIARLYYGRDPATRGEKVEV